MVFPTRILIIFFLANTLVSGQNNSGKLRNFNINDGLSQSTVMQVFQDKKGFIWLATSDGLNKFDGYQFTVYKYDHANPNSISENSIFSILLEDDDTNLWIYTGDFAINRFNLRKEQFEKYFLENFILHDLKSPMSAIHGYEDSRKNIWITSSSGLYLFDKQHNHFVPFHSVPGDTNTLPDNKILTVYEDSKGYCWILTWSGLCRFNYKSRTMIRYPAIPNDPTTLSLNHPLEIMEDKGKNLWILTGKGLNLYNREKNKFIRYNFSAVSPVTEKFDERYTMTTDSQNNIWIGSPHGLMIFNTLKKTYTCLSTKKKGDVSGLTDNHITKIYRDSQGGMWVGTTHGLNHYNPVNDNFIRYFHVSGDSLQNNISDIIMDKTGQTWVISNIRDGLGGTLNRLNIISGKLEPYPAVVSFNGLPDINLFSPEIDKSGNLWFGTFGGGVYKYSPLPENFRLYSSLKNSVMAPGGNAIWGFDEDINGNIWMALYNDGFDKFNPSTNQFQHFTPKKIHSRIPSYVILSVYCGNHDDIWLSTQGAGLIHYMIKSDRFEQFTKGPENSNSLASNFICRTYLVENDKLWIATSAGIDILDLKTKIFSHLKSNPHNPYSLLSNEIWYIFQDSKKELWFSCLHSIERYNPQTEKFTHYLTKSTDSTGLLAGKALCIQEDSRGNMWFGSSTAGLSMFDQKTNKFRHWTQSDGLPNSVVYGILEYPDGILWLSTNKGLSRFNIQENKFTNYDIASGLQSNEFNQFAFLKSRNNTLYFGGVNGFNAFKPNDIKKDTVVPKMVITGFQVFNKDVPVVSPSETSRLSRKHPTLIVNDSKGISLPASITYMDEIQLTYREKVFTFEYAALNFASTERIQYRYKMENFDPDWNYAENRRFATYTNLPPGEYTFTVSAANIDMVWNPQPTAIKVIILPPFWRSGWFIIAEILVVLAILILIIRIRERELNRSKARLERKVKVRTKEIAEKNEELELRNNQILKQKEEIEFQAKQLKAELTIQNKTSELSLLQSQINPHFLFNTLNNIYSLVYQKTDNAPSAIMKLSEIMRYMLYEASAEKVLLAMEIAYLNSYIELQLLRIRQKEFVSFTITGDYNGLKLSPMLLIPFVENAFKHGLKKWITPGIIINLTVTGRKINFEVINYIIKNAPINKDNTGGIGMANIKRRLDLLYCGRYALHIEKTDDIFHVQLELNEP